MPRAALVATARRRCNSSAVVLARRNRVRSSRDSSARSSRGANPARSSTGFNIRRRFHDGRSRSHARASDFVFELAHQLQVGFWIDASHQG